MVAPMLPLGSSPAITFEYNPHPMTPADVLGTFVGREDLLPYWRAYGITEMNPFSDRGAARWPPAFSRT